MNLKINFIFSHFIGKALAEEAKEASEQHNKTTWWKSRTQSRDPWNHRDPLDSPGPPGLLGPRPPFPHGDSPDPLDLVVPLRLPGHSGTLEAPSSLHDPAQALGNPRISLGPPCNHRYSS